MYLVPFIVQASNLLSKHKAVIEIFSDPGSSKGLAILEILYLIVKGRYKTFIQLSSLPYCSGGRLEKKP